ncbi:MAG: adenylate/guanylate cyclase domain-containing protein [Anaerostipes caccae]
MQSVEQIEIEDDHPPTIKELEDNNKTYVIQPAILFIDIRRSTYLTENSQAKSMVKIYRSFMRMAVDCVRKNEGVTRQFLGDRIMGVFMDTTDQDGNVTETAVKKALNCARSLQTVIDYSLNKYLKNNVNGKMIECGIGIDYGKVLVTKVGMYGVESDDSKEDETDCVWVGNTTNHASKYSDIAAGGEIFVSESVFKALPEEEKTSDCWRKCAKYKGAKLYEGYVAQDYYLDFAEDIGQPIRAERDNAVHQDTSFQLAEGIQELRSFHKELVEREKELAILEERLKQENLDYQLRFDEEHLARVEAEKEKRNCTIYLYQFTQICFYKLQIILYVIGRNNSFLDEFGIENICSTIDDVFIYGEKIGKGKDDITIDLGDLLIDVYNHFKLYEKAFNVMITMAQKSHSFYIRKETIEWAEKEYKLWKLIDIIDKNIEKESKSNWEDKLKEIKEIRGY